MTELTEPHPQGAPAWVDMMTGDRAGAAEFYGGLFGWDFEQVEAGRTRALVRGKPVAGFTGVPDDSLLPVVWTTYFATDDLDDTLALLVAHGGTQLGPAFDAGADGRGALAVDPTGAAFGLWEAGTHIGAHVVREPGAVWWNELATRDAAGAVEFYRAVLGLEPDPAPGSGYQRLSLDGHVVAGVFSMDDAVPEGIPAHWMAYFTVPDADVAATRARELGGVVVHPVVEVPFGRFTTLGDPSGATFRIIQPPPSPRG
ncbi:VOC family protein [Actinosynnema pretiosum subsp. pretiosum]|uniref:Glyoxalase/bleomycin resistance protein/dioxygenase n=2 Tax=Actinosynnema TaxID=40566 RepID=C6WRA9_ACTMD|nr:VOC family protein [Actinosynnema mirum]ACU35161.1 Glyoxalase/bleomycin resistance protein/dioxygenase [Actinosynnema mirum DSM 43827]AXX28540.1 putative hydroxylase [Actinosynnema pretiosum subsp. pretiosum]QUF07122.1 VOC family protein [Actinosynnema pretiosum subsp. pretiosum]